MTETVGSGGLGDKRKWVMLDGICGSDRIMLAIVVISGYNVLRVEILHNKTEGVKLYRSIIVLSKFSHRNKIFDDIRHMKNFVSWSGTLEKEVMKFP